MSLVKKLSFQQELASPPKLRHKASDMTADRCTASTRQEDIYEAQESCTSEFFDLLGYDRFLNEVGDSLKPVISSSTSSYASHKEVILDRFIPNRKASLFHHSIDSESDIVENDQNAGIKSQSESSALSVAEIYKRHVLGISNENGGSSEAQGLDSFRNTNILRYRHNLSKDEFPGLMKKGSLHLSEQLCTVSTQKNRKVAKLPAKVLDAPALQDDFYLNLIDWSEQNMLAVGLSSSVYLWSAVTSKVTKLCDLGSNDSVTGVSWTLRGPLLGIGTNSGEVQIWDTTKMKKARTMQGHTSRIGAIAWNSSMFSSGSRDKTILHRDLRVSNPFVAKLVGHKQEICGLKWSPDEQQLCSGGNDNKLFIWNAHSTQPIVRFNQHTAAVKAMAWSPHQHGLLASGGGTADRTIRFWNTLTATPVNCIDAGSQVCNLMFSKTVNELVSTHGYSQNQINIWKYPKMEKVSTLTGHTYRVLYLAMSPDGTTLVTGAGDETLRFWNVFPGRDDKLKKRTSMLETENNFIR